MKCIAFTNTIKNKTTVSKKTLLSILLLATTIVQAQLTIQWQNTIGGGLVDVLYSMQQTNDGGYILVGNSSSNISGDKTENSQGGADYWVVKLDSSGTIQWQNTIGGNERDILYSIQQTNDGGYILGGSSLSDISGDKTENSQGGLDYWVVKLDSSGTIQWQNTIGGNGGDRLFSIQQTGDGGYILGGFSNSPISGDKTEDSLGYDYWVVKLSPDSLLAGINNQYSLNQHQLIIYPNPNTGSFTLEMVVPEVKSIQINIINILGQSVYAETLNNTKGTCTRQIELNRNTTGIYNLQLTSDKEIINKKIVIN